MSQSLSSNVPDNSPEQEAATGPSIPTRLDSSTSQAIQLPELGLTLTPTTGRELSHEINNHSAPTLISQAPGPSRKRSRSPSSPFYPDATTFSDGKPASETSELNPEDVTRGHRENEISLLQIRVDDAENRRVLVNWDTMLCKSGCSLIGPRRVLELSESVHAPQQVCFGIISPFICNSEISFSWQQRENLVIRILGALCLRVSCGIQGKMAIMGDYFLFRDGPVQDVVEVIEHFSEQTHSYDRMEFSTSFYSIFWGRVLPYGMPFIFEYDELYALNCYAPSLGLGFLKEEAGVQLNAEQADWKDDTDDESEDQELEAHYMYMAQLQEILPQNRLQFVQEHKCDATKNCIKSNSHILVLANTCLRAIIWKIESCLKYSQGRSKEVEDQRRKFKFSNYKTSVMRVYSLNAQTSNVNFVCVTYGKCVLNDNHDLCVLHYINGVNSKNKQPMAVPVRTTKPKHNVNPIRLQHPIWKLLLESLQVISVDLKGNVLLNSENRRQLETDGEMCMFALTVSRTKPKKTSKSHGLILLVIDIKLGRTSSVFDRLDVWELVDRPCLQEVVRDSSKKEGIDFEESFAPVARLEAVRIVLIDFGSTLGLSLIHVNEHIGGIQFSSCGDKLVSGHPESGLHFMSSAVSRSLGMIGGRMCIGEIASLKIERKQMEQSSNKGVSNDVLVWIEGVEE
ncbi:hypothetical protein Tco_0769075 [Tanacetum coccineum]|uniref:Uncharacterized protein n=1 Tax=Tanacetum coccineum TaxID=301880 RepID=A0ABQ4Z8E1_9ASTR